MASASDFRDSYLTSFLVGYDWAESAHFAELVVRRDGLSDRRFRIERVTSWAAFEDFSAQHISQCTLLQDQDGIYLCLDPYSEGSRSREDNYWLVGASMAECPS